MTVLGFLSHGGGPPKSSRSLAPSNRWRIRSSEAKGTGPKVVVHCWPAHVEVVHGAHLWAPTSCLWLRWCGSTGMMLKKVAFPVELLNTIVFHVLKTNSFNIVKKKTYLFHHSWKNKWFDVFSGWFQAPWRLISSMISMICWKTPELNQQGVQQGTAWLGRLEIKWKKSERQWINEHGKI